MVAANVSFQISRVCACTLTNGALFTDFCIAIMCIKRPLSRKTEIDLKVSGVEWQTHVAATPWAKHRASFW